MTAEGSATVTTNDRKTERSTTTWELDPPAEAPRAFSQRGPIRVTHVIRERWVGGEHWSVRGVPLTTKGNPNGGVDRRFITEEAMDCLRARVLASDAAEPPKPKAEDPR